MINYFNLKFRETSIFNSPSSEREGKNKTVLLASQSSAIVIANSSFTLLAFFRSREGNKEMRKTETIDFTKLEVEAKNCFRYFIIAAQIFFNKSVAIQGLMEFRKF
jgi:hypothetical protein